MTGIDQGWDYPHGAPGSLGTGSPEAHGSEEAHGSPDAHGSPEVHGSQEALDPGLHGAPPWAPWGPTLGSMGPQPWDPMGTHGGPMGAGFWKIHKIMIWICHYIEFCMDNSNLQSKWAQIYFKISIFTDFLKKKKSKNSNFWKCHYIEFCMGNSNLQSKWIKI